MAKPMSNTILNSAGLIPLMVLAAMLLNLSQCSKPKPKTAKDFIEQYSAAWESGDLDKIMSMKEGNQVLANAKMDDKMKAQIQSYNQDQDRERIKDDINAKAMSWQMWSNTKYVSEKDHQDHIHVDVKVRGFNSSVVLVKQPDGALKISEFPSMYKD
jgi:hypothetical protein